MTKLQFVASMSKMARAWAETAMACATTPTDKLPPYYPAPGSGAIHFDDAMLAQFCSMDTLSFAQQRCALFVHLAKQTHSEALISELCDNLESAGCDLFLTVNGSGAGFWDGDWIHGEQLTELTKEFSSVDSEFRDRLVRIYPS